MSREDDSYGRREPLWLGDIDGVDLVILERLAKTKKVTDHQRLAIQRVCSVIQCEQRRKN